ncbi:LysE family translocator [Roseinatronobacter alkalisoli]|uniref:LysE family translocator n=1 Tax=Roseinatronobacter alkalisoli TaxID=3028235 RepID=A0ABT5T6Q7_9RHOB|nr:LysE family translocator [Roseinatronobacter sp. HJB301]MDD7970808.1 LysE family translocator [Roseinatronobacter sp. HJB301]
MTFEFLLTSLIIVASPGTGAIYTIAAGLTGGARSSVVAALGCTLGIVPHMLAAISGLAVLFHTSALAFQALKYLGVVYLLYMAWTILKDRSMLSVSAAGGDKTWMQVIVSAVLINVLNPKLSIFFFAFLPIFVAPDDVDPIGRMIALSLVFMALTFVIFAAYGGMAAALRQHVIRSATVQTWMRRGFGAAFAILAVQLAATQR